MTTGDILLTPAQRDDLRAMAAEIIPASAEFDVPGAGDPAIQALALYIADQMKQRLANLFD